MRRRDVLKTAGLVLGYTITAGTAAAVMSGCNADPVPTWTPSFISEEEAKLIRSMSDVIIPGTDKLPGAKDVMIDKFVDETISQFYKADAQRTFREGFAAFTEAIPEFHSLSAKEKLSTIKKELDADSKFVRKVYELSVTGFCTSERGMKEVLVFDPIPGEQKGSVPVEEVGGIYAI